jgi:hypothetical protein
MVVNETRRTVENLVLERREEGVLEFRTCMFFLVEFVKLIEEGAD